MHIYTILKMPNTKSAIRRVRRVKKQTQVNRIRKSKYKTAVKQMELHLKSKEKENFRQIIKIINFKLIDQKNLNYI